MSDAKLAGLQRAAQVVQRALARVSESKAIHAAWKTGRRGDTYIVTTDHLPAYMIETNDRHPVYARGDRSKWHWTHQDHGARVGDKGFATRTVDRTIDLAGDELLDGS
jgi:hypothetical protein